MTYPKQLQGGALAVAGLAPGWPQAPSLERILQSLLRLPRAHPTQAAVCKERPGCLGQRRGRTVLSLLWSAGRLCWRSNIRWQQVNGLQGAEQAWTGAGARGTRSSGDPMAHGMQAMNPGTMRASNQGGSDGRKRASRKAQGRA